MKKHLTLAKLSIQQQLTYRGNIIMYRFGEFAGTLLLVFIWLILYSERETIKGYTLAEMITYLAGVGAIEAFSRTWIADTIERDVHRGRLSALLLKPLSYFRYRFFYDFSRKQVSTWFSILTYFLLICLLRRYFVVNTDFLRWALFLASVLGVVLLRFLLFFMIGLFSFWFIQIGGFQHSFEVFLKILSGSYLPLELFPKTLETAARFLPFAYMQYFSMQIYLKKISIATAFWGLMVQFSWILVLATLAKIFWKKALKHYESVGI